MTADVNAWLASQQRFSCERLSAALTVAQCEANRKRDPVIFACQNCAGLGTAVKTEVNVGYSKDQECVACKKVKPIMARGLCPACYHAKKRDGSIDQVPAKIRLPNKKHQQVRAASSASSISNLLPVVDKPNCSSRMVVIPDDLAARMTEISDDDVIDLLDALIHGELERHTYRRAA